MHSEGDLVGQSQETVRQGTALSNININQEGNHIEVTYFAIFSLSKEI